MTSQYTHLPLDEPIEFLSASYWISREDIIPYKGQEVLCVVRETSPMSCCDGCCSTGFISILIPGFIIRFKHKKREDGLFVSEVEPIEDEKTIEEIRRVIKKKYNQPQVEFLCP